ncbi:hypothetical protein MSMEI_0837 [Mycolicibacterium smegmatis MC2 155]|uniref:Polyketide cyclase / dehydrase and lipid transport n=3 Tax=Mycolicibacterium smegmatis TaxID=1772 RepID=I7FX48_MYCS2|nr:hypothetical protein MSMEI_0837 [Mycolicibacterium smegmatis MC2 155]
MLPWRCHYLVRSFYMERLPYIDEHAITLDADTATTWSAVLTTLCGDAADPRAPFGFAIADFEPGQRLSLRGRHVFAVYEWVFILDASGPRQTRLRSQTWAAFPGPHGKVYRALVIGTGGHRVVVRRTLKRIAGRARQEQKIS